MIGCKRGARQSRLKERNKGKEVWGNEEAGTDKREQGLLVGYAGEKVSLKTFSQPGLGHRAEGGCMRSQ